MSAVIAFEGSALLETLLETVPLVLDALGTPERWAGYDVRGEGEAGYVRAVCRDDLVVAGRRYLAAAHVFTRADEALHDHRWPLAVLPLADEPGGPLYEQRWCSADGRDEGTVLVHAGQAWAMERAEDRHALRSLRPHLSLNLTDVTDPPSRENRLRVTALSAAETATACARVASAARRWLALRELELIRARGQARFTRNASG